MSSTQTMWLIGVAVLVFWSVGAYNRLVGLRNVMRAAFGQLEAQLHRRHELIPELAEAARQRPEAEALDPAMLEAAVAARHQAHAALTLARSHPGATGPTVSLAMAEQVLTDVCRRLQQVIDAQAALRSNAEVQTVRDELLGAEGRLGFARQMYNDAVSDYNQAVRQFPTRVLSSLFGFPEAAPLPPPAEGGAQPT